MARKKNQTNGNEAEKEKPSIHGDAKRSILAVFLSALAVLLVLGFFGKSGALGNYLNKLISLSFGFGKWLFPVAILAVSGVFLFRKETLFYVLKIAGIAVFFTSLVGLLHLYGEPGKMKEVAAAGLGGGYLGWLIAWLLLKLTGVTGGSVILVAFLVIGLILTFNFSLAGLFKGVWKKEEFTEEESKIKEQVEAESKEEDSKKEFVKGPDEDKEKEEKDLKEESVKESLAGAFSRKTLRKGTRMDIFAENYLEHSDGNGWKLPPLDLLEESTGKAQGGDTKRNAEIIQKTLSHFGIEVELGGIQTGPTITQYTFRPAVGIKLSRITALGNDLALALAAHPIRIEAPIPGKSLVGIEVPNKSVATVRMKDILQSDSFRSRKSNLLVSLGKNVNGDCLLGDLAKMPHLMIAGSTGSGKSVCVNSILLSLLYQNSPSDLNLILVDPKRVELSLYNGIPHLLSEVIVENGKVLSALKWSISEMERRYLLLQQTGSRDIVSYNQKVTSGHKNKKVNSETGEVEEEEIKKLPYIVIVVDELADLMSSHGKEVEGAIIRLAQMARAVGIHLIVSTQRPSVEVLTGLIKANITTRIAFKVATQIDSRTILDGGGAEKLLGNGDMLYLTGTSEGMKRIQGAFVSESEVKRVVKFVKNQKVEKGVENIGENIIASSSSTEGQKINFDSLDHFSEEEDSLYDEAKKVVTEAGKASASLLQRRLRVGYARAARLLDILEERGVVGPGEGAKPREVYAGGADTQYKDPAEDQAKRDKWQL